MYPFFDPSVHTQTHIAYLGLGNAAAEGADIARGAIKCAFVNITAERLNAHIVNIVCLVKHEDGLLFDFLRNLVLNFRVDDVCIVVHDHVGKSDHVASGKVGAPALFAPERAQVIERVDTRRQQALCAVLVKSLVEAADFNGRVLLLALPHPRGCDRAAFGVDRHPIALLRDRLVDAHVAARGQAKREDLAACGANHRLAVLDELAQLLERLFHLGHGARAVDELGDLGVRKLVRGDEREQCDGLAGPRRHLEHAVLLVVERLLQLHHVVALLLVDVRVRKVHCHLINVENHGAPPV